MMNIFNSLILNLVMPVIPAEERLTLVTMVTWDAGS